MNIEMGAISGHAGDRCHRAGELGDSLDPEETPAGWAVVRAAPPTEMERKGS